MWPRAGRYPSRALGSPPYAYVMVRGNRSNTMYSAAAQVHKMAQSMRRSRCALAFLQLGSAVHHRTHVLLQVCKTAQSKLASPMTSKSTRRSGETLSVIVDCYLMNSNWVFSKRGPYSSSTSPWPAHVVATTTNHNPASYVLVIRPRLTSWQLVRTAERPTASRRQRPIITKAPTFGRA